MENHETAERAFIECEGLWAKTNAPLRVAYAKAVPAILLGPDSEFAQTKLSEARTFFEKCGIRAHLEGVRTRVPQEQTSSGLAG